MSSNGNDNSNSNSSIVRMVSGVVIVSELNTTTRKTISNERWS
jgi:hypothetical protein